MIDFTTGEEKRKKEKFLNHMNELASIWQNITNKARLKKYYSAVENLPEAYWDEFFDSIIENERNMPLPKDFLNTAMNLKKQKKIWSEEFYENKNDCSKCMDSGLIFIKLKPNEPTVFMFCSCDKGIENEIYYHGSLPKWNNNFSAIGFEVQEFDLKLFTPENKLPEECTFSDIVSNEVFGKFRTKFNESKEYFKKLNERQNSGEIKI